MAKIKLWEFLKELADKAGIPETDPALTEALALEQGNAIEIPETVASRINQNLLSITDANNDHPKVKKHYFGEFMANVDRGLETLYEVLELSSDVVAKLNTERSSTKRIGLLGEVLKETIEEKTAAGGKPNERVQSMQRTIDDLNEKLRIEKEARTKEADEHKKALTDYKTTNKLTGKYAGVKTVYDNLPADVRNTTIDTLVRNELQDSEVVLVLNEDGNLKLQKKDGSNYYDETNRLVTIDDFINKTLAKHKVLQQSAPDNQQPDESANTGNQNQGRQPANVPAGQQGKKVNLSNLFSESTKPLETSENNTPKML